MTRPSVEAVLDRSRPTQRLPSTERRGHCPVQGVRAGGVGRGGSKIDVIDNEAGKGGSPPADAGPSLRRSAGVADTVAGWSPGRGGPCAATASAVVRPYRSIQRLSCFCVSGAESHAATRCAWGRSQRGSGGERANKVTGQVGFGSLPRTGPRHPAIAAYCPSNFRLAIEYDDTI
jgi:hypothetical protein